jgi:hypothetical protein
MSQGVPAVEGGGSSSGLLCVHGKRVIEFPGGRALLTSNGSWTVYYRARGGEVFVVRPGGPCPGCGVELWGLPEAPVVDVPAQAHSMKGRLGHD